MLIAQLTDLHVRPSGIPAYRVVDTNMLVERAFAAVAALRPVPDAVILSGDLTDKGLAEEYDILAALLRRYLAMPVFLIPGNHDRREVMKERLAHLPGVAADPEFVHYAVEDFPLRLVMLDSVAPGYGHGELCAARLDFLERTLAAAPEKPTVVALHHPPIRCGIEHMDEINLRSADAFATVIARHPQVERVLCGHHHRPIVARFAGTLVQVAPSVAHQVKLDLEPGAEGLFVMEPPGYLLHRWEPGAGLVSHHAYVESYPGPYPFAEDKDPAGAMTG
ncbi:MAG TPA: phosphodiesterase [Candidatus Cybelea sp.]|nr:phosphodiesterase [Candidatus Cybelea sp.]